MITFSSPAKHGNGYLVRAHEDENPVWVKIDKARLSVADWILHEVDSPRLSEIDTLIKDSAKENKKEWFGRELADSTLDRAFNASVDKNGLVEVRCAKDGPVMYGPGNTEVSMDSFNPDEPCSVLLQFVGIWFLQKSYGPLYKLVQVKQSPPKPRRNMICMFDPEEDSVEDEDDVVTEFFNN